MEVVLDMAVTTVSSLSESFSATVPQDTPEKPVVKDFVPPDVSATASPIHDDGDKPKETEIKETKKTVEDSEESDIEGMLEVHS